jgi:hypothetical protein
MTVEISSNLFWCTFQAGQLVPTADEILINPFWCTFQTGQLIIPAVEITTNLYWCSVQAGQLVVMTVEISPNSSKFNPLKIGKILFITTEISINID